MFLICLIRSCCSAPHTWLVQLVWLVFYFAGLSLELSSCRHRVSSPLPLVLCVLVSFVLYFVFPVLVFSLFCQLYALNICLMICFVTLFTALAVLPFCWLCLYFVDSFCSLFVQKVFLLFNHVCLGLCIWAPTPI